MRGYQSNIQNMMQVQSEIPPSILLLEKAVPSGFLVVLMRANTRQLMVNYSIKLKVVKNIA